MNKDKFFFFNDEQKLGNKQPDISGQEDFLGIKLNGLLIFSSNFIPNKII